MDFLGTAAGAEVGQKLGDGGLAGLDRGLICCVGAHIPFGRPAEKPHHPGLQAQVRTDLGSAHGRRFERDAKSVEEDQGMRSATVVVGRCDRRAQFVEEGVARPERDILET